MHVRVKYLLLNAIFILTLSSTYGQRRGHTRNPFNIIEGLSYSGAGGINVFFGDLVDHSRSNLSFGGLVNRQMTPIFDARFQITGGNMRGTQIDQVVRTPYAYFENFYLDLMVGGAYRPLDHLLGHFKQRRFQPYGLFQTGIIYFESTEYWGPASGNQAGSIWRKATGIAPIISSGAGVNIWITPNISANFEFDGTLAFSDKLDVHDVWYDHFGQEFGTDPFDFYYTITAGVSYLIEDSPFRNNPRFNRRSFNRTREFFQPKTPSRSRFTRPRRGNQGNRWLFF